MRSSPRPRRRLKSAACAAGLLAGLAGLAAGRFAHAWIVLDIFNHFIPHILVAIGACLLGLVMPRAKLFTAIVVILIGVTGIGLWPHYVSRQGAAPIETAAGERIVRVMAFNTRWQNPDWRAVADEIVRQDPDIVAMTEVGDDKLPLFEALRVTYPHRADCRQEPFCLIVILSKFPFTSSGIATHWLQPPLVRVEYGPELGELTVVATHMLRPPLFSAQLRQMRVFGDLLAEDARSQIVIGDFNATPRSRMLLTFIERSGLELVSGLPTWPATLGLPQIAIDHIFVTPQLRVVGPARIGSPAGSDHYPVIAEIAIPAP